MTAKANAMAAVPIPNSIPSSSTTSPLQLGHIGSLFEPQKIMNNNIVLVKLFQSIPYKCILQFSQWKTLNDFFGRGAATVNIIINRQKRIFNLGKDYKSFYCQPNFLGNGLRTLHCNNGLLCSFCIEYWPTATATTTTEELWVCHLKYLTIIRCQNPQYLAAWVTASG